MTRYLQLSWMSLVFIFVSLGAPKLFGASDFTADLSLDQEPELFFTPSPQGRTPFLKAMAESRSEIRLYMYRLTDSDAVNELIKANGRGLRVRVLLDQSMASGAGVQKSITAMKAAGVEVQMGSNRFSMTHAKTMVLDDNRALVTTMNLTWTASYSRGLGLDVRDKSVTTELIQGFDQDWKDAVAGVVPVGPPISKVKDANLIWSPDNSEVRLIQMVTDARNKIEVMVENLGATPLLDALITAAKKGIPVRVLVPLCTTSSDPLHNWEYIQKLKTGGVEIRNMPIPYSAAHPYTHAKAMLIDGRLAYVGSQNFSKNSLQSAREVGLIFDNAASVSEVGRIWSEDWGKALPPPAGVGASTCPAELVQKSEE